MISKNYCSCKLDLRSKTSYEKDIFAILSVGLHTPIV